MLVTVCHKVAYKTTYASSLLENLRTLCQHSANYWKTSELPVATDEVQSDVRIIC